MDKKSIAKYALGFIGGKPIVDRFYNADESESIDVLTSTTGALNEIPTCTTIGLSEKDIGLNVDGKSLRIELLASGKADAELVGNIISSAAFDVYDSGKCCYGMIISNIVANYIKGSDMKHALLMTPVFWLGYSPMKNDDTIIAWLMIIPISDREKAFIEEKGVDEFDKSLEKNGVDVLDPYRNSLF